MTPEIYAGLISRLFFWWANGLLRAGCKSVLVLEDIYALEQGLDADVTGAAFHAEWQKGASWLSNCTNIR